MPTRDRLLACTVALLWGVNFVAIDFGLRQFPPLFFAGLRFAVLAIPTVLLVPRPAVPLRWLAGYGLGFGTTQFAFLFIAMRIGMPPGLASLVLQASAPFTVLLGAIFLHERPRAVQLIGIGLAVAGMAAIVWHRAQLAAALPVLLTLCGALGWAVGNLCSRQAMASGSASRSANPLHLTLWMSVIPPVPLFTLSLLIEGAPADVHSMATIATRTGWVALGSLVYVVLLATVLGSGVWTTLMRRHPAGMVAPFSLLVPVVGIAAAWLVLGERPALMELLAGVVVVTGVLLGTRRRRQLPTPTEPLPEIIGAGNEPASRTADLSTSATVMHSRSNPPHPTEQPR